MIKVGEMEALLEVDGGDDAKAYSVYVFHYTHLERMNECNCLSCFSEQYFTGALKLKSILCWKFDGMPSITVPNFW